MFETDPDGTPDGRHRIVIVGGGVAGLDLAGALGRAGTHDVTLVDRATSHVWKPMLHSVAAGTHDPAFAGTPYVAQSRQHGFAYQPGRATAIDTTARAVVVAPFALHGHRLLDERRLRYDTLVLAVGSVADPFDTPGVAEHAHHIDTLDEARAFQEEMVPRLLRAAQKEKRFDVAIVGGGATGVQLAAELLTMADRVDHFGLGHARDAVRVTLVERGDRVLSPFPERVSAAARARLGRLGVVVRTGVEVAAVDADGLDLTGGERIAADLTVWAAGVRAPPLAAGLDEVEQGPGGRIVVDDRLRTALPGVFAMGDCAALTLQGEERPLPPTAQVAYRQAVYLGRNLSALIAGRDAPAFRYRDAGAIVQLGEYEAYGALGQYGFLKGSFFRGKAAQAAHALLYRRHQARLHGPRRALGLWLSDKLTTRARPREGLG